MLPVLCLTIFVIFVVWVWLPWFSRVMIPTLSAISIFVCLSLFFFLMIRRPPRSPFFPYTPFFRSRFHWFFFVYSFLFVFNNHNLIAKNGNMAVYIPLQKKVLQRYKKKKNMNGLPADLGGYEAF